MKGQRAAGGRARDRRQLVQSSYGGVPVVRLAQLVGLSRSQFQVSFRPTTCGKTITRNALCDGCCICSTTSIIHQAGALDCLSKAMGHSACKLYSISKRSATLENRLLIGTSQHASNNYISMRNSLERRWKAKRMVVGQAPAKILGYYLKLVSTSTTCNVL